MNDTCVAVKRDGTHQICTMHQLNRLSLLVFHVDHGKGPLKTINRLFGISGVCRYKNLLHFDWKNTKNEQNRPLLAKQRAKMNYLFIYLFANF